MKQKIYIAALLAGMLALAGCGGGSSSGSGDGGGGGDDKNDPPLSQADCDDATIYSGGKCLTEEQIRADEGEKIAEEDKATDAKADAASLHAALSPTNGFGNGTNGLDRTDVTFQSNGDLRIATSPDIDLEKTDATVSALEGWTGAQYTTTTGTDKKVNREAHVYTKVSPGTEGLMFASTETDKVGAPNPEETDESMRHTHRYTLILLDNDDYNIGRSGITFAASEVATINIDSFTQTAGSRDYTKPTGSTAAYISEAGSYHGVRGTFYCSGAEGAACRVNHAGENKQTFETNAAWRFAPNNPDDRITMGEATPLASYGWWLNKDDDDNWIVGVFDINRRSAAAAVPSSLNTRLESGSATYRGGAAGKYALSSSTGGRNEAGHFTASVELTAKFGDSTATPVVTDMISGTVSNFKDGKGADIDGDWLVDLNKATINGTGVIGATTLGTTTWKVGEADGTAAGSWSGNMWNEGSETDGVPDIVTGTFNAHLGLNGRMAGAFGADHTAAP